MWIAKMKKCGKGTTVIANCLLLFLFFAKQCMFRFLKLPKTLCLWLWFTFLLTANLQLMSCFEKLFNQTFVSLKQRSFHNSDQCCCCSKLKPKSWFSWSSVSFLQWELQQRRRWQQQLQTIFSCFELQECNWQMKHLQLAVDWFWLHQGGFLGVIDLITLPTMPVQSTMILKSSSSKRCHNDILCTLLQSF